MYEHMAYVGSLDIINLLTMNADTKKSLTGDDFPNQSQQQVGTFVGRSSVTCTLVDETFSQNLPRGCLHPVN